MWPMKEAFIQKMQVDQQKEKMHKLKQKENQARMSPTSMEKMVEMASSKAEAFSSASKEAQKEAQAAIVDNSRKAFYKEFKQVVETADVILQVLDARDPMGCRVREVEQMVLEGGSGKRIVLVLNKIDLVPKEVLENWLKYLRTQLPTVAFKASTQSQKSNIGQIRGGTSTDINTSECLGADNLIQLLKNYCRSLNIKTSIRVGVVGYPNVGKSSLINSLKRSKVCKVGATPGVTTVSQEISLDKNIKLLDCPGIVFSSDDENSGLFLRNVLKVEQLADPITPVTKIVEKCSREQLMQIYQVPAFNNGQEFLLAVARRQGKLKKGGLPNFEAAAKAVLNDWNMGKIPFYTLPPAVEKTSGEAAIVSTWAPEFDLTGIHQMEVENVLSVVQHIDHSVAMAEDSEPAPLLTEMVIGEGYKKNRKGDKEDLDYSAKLSLEEARLNPQTNKKRQKDLKKAKKAANKASSNDMDVDEDYDFAADFHPQH